MQKQGKPADAELVLVQALRLQIRDLGREHPTTLLMLENLAHMVYRNGDLELAQSICKKTLAVRRDVQGNGHPDTIRSASRLAQLLEIQGKHQKAKEVNRGRHTPGRASQKVRRAAMCANCRTSETGDRMRFSTCSQCKVARYCSRDCQKAHWKAQHKHQCVRLLL